MTMKSEEFEQVTGFCRQRADVYRMLASLVDREVNKKSCSLVAKLGGAETAADMPEAERSCVEGMNIMAACVNDFTQDIEDTLACDFARVFLASGQYEGQAAVPYESIYTSEEGILMQDARDQVRAIFREAGVMPGGDENIPEDYLPFEFEYMAVLNDRLAEALAAGDEAGAADFALQQRGFLHNHLLNWIDDLAKDINRMAETPFYHALADVIQGFLTCESEDVDALVEATRIPVAC